MNTSPLKKQPLLAAEIENPELLEKLRYPVFASPKYDGIRMRIDPNLGAITRTHIRVPNRHLQSVIKEYPNWDHFDGEVTVGDPTDPLVFNNTQSALMRHEGEPEFSFHVFDCYERPDDPFIDRYAKLFSDILSDSSNIVKIVPQELMHNADDVRKYEGWAIGAKYEGIMLRDPYAPYKFGRSTFKQGILLKLKRSRDAEAVIVAIHPLVHNNNKLEKNEYGKAKRSTQKAGMVTLETMGSIEVKSKEFEDNFSLGTGFDPPAREWFWENRENLIGKVVTFKYQEAGIKKVPRFPVYKGLRED